MSIGSAKCLENTLTFPGEKSQLDSSFALYQKVPSLCLYVNSAIFEVKILINHFLFIQGKRDAYIEAFFSMIS